jgi:3'-5' exoribonuclease
MKEIMALSEINYSQQEAIQFKATVMDVGNEGQEDKKRPMRFSLKMESSGETFQAISWNYSILQLLKDAAKTIDVIEFEALSGTFNTGQQIRVGNAKITGVQSLKKTIRVIDTSGIKRDLNSIINKYISTKPIRDMIEALVINEPRFFEWPAATKLHHDYEGGLAVHTLNVVNHAISMWENYKGEELDIEVVVAGAILHDIGKLTEYNKDGSKTAFGHLISHIIDGTEKVSEYCIRNNIDANRDKKMVLIKHVILSHHERLDFGSPVQPATMEAIIVAKADTLDAVVGGVRKELDNLSVGELTGNLTINNGAKVLKWK